MSQTRSMARKRWLGVLGGLLVSAMVMSTWGSQPAGAADESRLNAGIGFPEWAGSDQPVPELPVPHTVDNQLQAIFDADLAAGAGTDPGTDFWIDKMLARHGNAGGHGDSNNWLFTRGRAAYMYNHQPRTIGFGGSAAYWHELNVSSIYAISLDVDGTEVEMTEDIAARKQTPSYWTSTFVNEDAGLRLVQTKFMTHNNVAVTNLSLSSTDSAAKSVRLTAASPLAGTADGDELTGIRTTRNNITTLHPRLSADGFAPESGKLVREVGVPAGGSVDLKVQLGFVTQEIAESATEYEQYRALSPAEAYSKHVTAYNRWWAENVPFLDTPEDNIDKTLFYRWWLMRFNFLDADVPGNDYQFPTSMEGVTGYNNAIVLTAGMFIDDLKYFRDPAYSYGPWVSAGETARSGKMVDNPGSPSNWSNSYTEYITEAGWRSYQLHGGPAAIARNLATYGENDVRGLLDAYDSNGNNLIEYDWGAMTGNDADAVSFDWAREHGHTNMDRAENAYLYSNAMASAQAYRASGDDAKADEVEDLANTIKAAVMDTLWNEEDNLIEHRQAGGDRLLVDWKEINNYYPFSVGLVPKPGEEDYDDDYVEALRLWKYADEYPIFPFYTANQVDAAERGDGGSNNFSIINSTVTFRMLSRVLRDYPNEYIGNDYYKKLLYWNAWAHYIDGDNRLLDQNEFWNTGTANTEWGDTQGIGFRSWIHHTILGTTNFTMIEDAMGLRPRSDGKLELDPIDIDWPHFMANNIRYRNMDLTIVWDDPADGERPYGKRVPEGYSAFLDGKLAFTADSLGRVVYDPASGDIVEKDAGVEVVKVHKHKKAQQPTQVRFADGARVVDLFAKAGADIATATTRVDNLAEGADATATYVSDAGYSSTEAAVDGTTINEPFWGTVGSPNERDSLEVDLGARRTFDEVRLYFYRTSSSDAPQGGRQAGTRQGYAAPSMYSVEYLDGSTWRTVGSQAKSPVYPRGNYNLVQFPRVVGSKVRVTVTHAPGFRTGVKEIQVRRTGIDAPPVSNAPPSVSARVDTSYTKAGSARLIGTVLDDALPEGSLSAQWSVVSAPDGGTALFEDTAAATTLVRFSQPGSYTLRLTADDGALTKSFDLVVEGTAASEGGNVAPAAQPTASFTAGWNDVNAVNNGTGQNSGGQQSEVWGTWSGDRPPTQWLQYTWDDPVRIASSEIMYWTDAAAGSGQGVAVPASWSMQYRDSSTGEWVDVPNPDGYGTERTGINTTRFDAVTTTALRANFNASPNAAGTSYSAIGVAEWQVFSEAPESVVDIDLRTLVGEVPTLPEQVGVVFSDGSRGTASVAWPQITEEQVASDGDFTVHGIVDGTPQMVAATVWVRSGPPGQINTIDPVAVHTPVGVAPQLPDKATVQYNDGSREMLPVTWDPIDPASYSDHNTFAVEGAVEGPGTTTATATVVVGNG